MLRPLHARNLAGISVALVSACSSSSMPSMPGDAATSHMDQSAPPDGSVADSGSRLDGRTLDAGDGAPPLEAGTRQSTEATFYGWADNSPPGGAIAYPMSCGFPTLHNLAGGTGTYADPITFASDKNELPVGTRVYAAFIEKYLIMEDDCGQCDTDWSTSHIWHIDIWMNSNGTETPSALFACEDQWTQSSTPIEIDPPPGRKVTKNPLFDPSTNTCRSTP
jgi:hypothetical protein